MAFSVRNYITKTTSAWRNMNRWLLSDQQHNAMTISRTKVARSHGGCRAAKLRLHYSPNSTWLVTSRLDTLDTTSSTGSTRRTCRVRVVSRRAKWNLGLCTATLRRLRLKYEKIILPVSGTDSTPTVRSVIWIRDVREWLSTFPFPPIPIPIQSTLQL